MEEERSFKSILILALRCAVALGLALAGYFYWNEANFPWWVSLMVMGTAYILISYDIYIEAFEAMFKEREFFNECTLMILASLGAFALRFYGPGHNEFLEAVLIILLYQVGEVFENLAESRSRKAIVSAIDLRKEEALVLEEDKLIAKSPVDLHVGDLVVLGAGKKCPCDGIVMEGTGEMDESSLTGEAVPVGKEKESPVYSGTLLASGSLKIRVEKEYEDSTVARLMESIENGSEEKNKTVRFIRRFARVYTPIVFAIAALVAVVPPLVLGAGNADIWASWIYTALSFLVLSCPCAIVISVPLAYVAGLGLASKQGILVKGAGFFDALNTLRLIAFDKTGTLTEGHFSVAEIQLGDLDEALFKEYLCAAESRSTHPMGRAIAQTFQKAYEEEEISDYQEVPGFGVRLVYRGKKIEAGTPKDASAHAGKAGSLVCLYVDDVYQGCVRLEDQVKESAPKAISHFHQKNISTLLLSGDRPLVVESTAKEIGVDAFEAGLLPDEKTSRIREEISKKEGAVAFVGDGINDAPSIVLADVGIAMGGPGSDLAVANADIVIMDDDLMKIPALLDIARKTRHRVIFNIIFALSVKAILMGLNLWASIDGGWQLPLWVSALGDSGLALLTILGSLALGFSKPKKSSANS